MRIKPKVPWAQRFPRAAPAALKLLERLLAFDPDDRPTAEEALADPFFNGLADPSREPAAEVVSRTGYTFESKKLTREEVRSLLYREILEYHPQAKREFEGGEKASHFMYPSGAGAMGTDFAAAEEREAGAKGEETGMKNDKKRHLRSSQSLPRETVNSYHEEAAAYMITGAGALKRSDSIAPTQTPSAARTQTEMDEMMDAAESMSLDDKELQEAAEQAREMMRANSQV